ncbi:hypothetical protein [Streptomyces marincola]|uniref:hypothetical protein n=1 Tax=Streptomyces marincola TaxID=2878388 RepID=UPI001CF36928|nr:hypothetical protein [Streptomyces marincola]UCM90411.1 hypothetical protein LC193_22135 [Streptomyces marincola]
MARPPDWSALGMDDPTPGDPDQLQELITSQGALVDLADEIDGALTELMNAHSTTFVGQTAQALRDMMDGRLRDYISGFREAHQTVQDALVTYRTVMIEQQGIADSALTAAQGLDEDDEEGRETHKSTAETARDTLESAANTAGEALNSAAYSIPSAVDECAEFWKFLTIFALVLIIPAMIFGGVVALAAIALNAALLIKTAVDFSKGDASVTDLVLGILGVLIPTTRGINITKIGSSFKSWSKTTFKPMGQMNGLGKFMYLTYLVGRPILYVPVHLFRGIKNAPMFANMSNMNTLGKFMYLGNLAFRGLAFVPVHLTRAGATFASFSSDALATAWRANGFAGAIRTVGDGISWAGSTALTRLNGLTGFSGYVWANAKLGGLTLVVPVNAAEIGAKFTWTGLGQAAKIGFWNRGVLNQFRTGAFVQGNNAIDIRAFRGIADDGKVVADVNKLIRYQPGGAAGLHTISNTMHLVAFGDIGRGAQGLVPGNFGMGDMPSSSPISLSFADRGLHVGMTHIPGLGDSLADVPRGSGGLGGMPPASLVVHAPGVDGRPVAITVPLLSDGFAAGGRGGDVSVVINLDGFTPIRVTYGENGLTIVPVNAGGGMPAINVSGMPQLGEMSLVPSSGLSIPPANLSPSADLANQALGGLNGAPRLGANDLAFDINVGSMPSLRLNFADDGLSLSMPDISLTGASRPTVDFPPVETPTLSGINNAAPALPDTGTLTPPALGQTDHAGVNVGVHAGGLPPGVSVTAPHANQLNVGLGNANNFSINLADGLRHSVDDLTAATPNGQFGNVDATVAPPAGGITASPAGATPPPARADTGSLADISVNVNGIAPIKISSIEAKPVASAANADSALNAGLKAGGPGVSDGIRAAQIPTPAAATPDVPVPTGLTDGANGVSRGTEAVDGPGLIATGRATPPVTTHLPEAAVPVPQPAPAPPPAAASQSTANGTPPPSPAPVKGNGTGGGGGSSLDDLFTGKLWDINPDLAAWRALEALGLTRNAPPPALYGSGPMIGFAKTPPTDFDPVEGIELRTLTQNNAGQVTDPAATPTPPNVAPAVTESGPAGTGPLPAGTQTFNTPVHGLGTPPGTVPAPAGGPPSPLTTSSFGPPPPASTAGGAGGTSATHTFGPLDDLDDLYDASRPPTPGPSHAAPGGGHLTGAPPDSAIVRLSETPGGGSGITPLPAQAAPPAPATVTIPVPGPGGFHVTATIGEGGDIGRVTVTAPGGDTIAATRADDAADTFRAQQDLGGGVTRDWRFRLDGNELADLTVYRHADLSGFDGFQGARLRFDELSGTGTPTLLRRGADGAEVVQPNAVSNLGAHLNGSLVTFDGSRLVVGADGLVTHRVVPVPGGTNGHHVFAPVGGPPGGATIRTLDGQQVDGVTATAQVGGGTRLEGAGVHVSVNATGTEFHNVIELTGRGGNGLGTFVHTPVGGGAPVVRAADGAGAGTVAGGVVRVPGAEVTTVHRLDGALVEEVFHLRGGPDGLNGRDLTVPANGNTGRLGTAGGEVDVTLTPQVGGGLRFEGGGHHAVVGPRGDVTHTVVEVTGRGGGGVGAFVHTPVGGGAPVVRAADGAGAGTVAGGVVRVPGAEVTTVHRLDGALVEEVFHLRGGPDGLNGRDLTVPANGNTGRLGTAGGEVDVTLTPQVGGGLRFEGGGHHAVVGPRGDVTHSAVEVTGRGGGGVGAFVHTPVGGGAPVVRAADGAGAGTVAGGVVRVPGAEVTTVHRLDGALVEEVFHLRGGPDGLNGRDFAVSADGTTGQLHTAAGARPVTVTPQLADGVPTGFRFEGEGHHLVINPRGEITHDVVRLRPPGTPGAPGSFGFIGRADADDLTVRTVDGGAVPGADLARLPDGGFSLSTRNGDVVDDFTARGDWQSRTTRLPGNGPQGADEFVRMRHAGNDPGRPVFGLFDENNVAIPDRSALPRPLQDGSTGFRVDGADGAFRLHGPGGRVDVAVSAPDANGIRNVTIHAADGGAPTNLRVVELSDGVNSRFVDVTRADAPRLLDGEMSRMDGVAVTRLANDAGFEVRPQGGVRANEWQTYSTSGKITGQRIDVYVGGRVVDGQSFRITYPEQGTPTWTRGAEGAGGHRSWHDFGEVDIKGMKNGHVALISHTGDVVFDRRVLPSGRIVDSHAANPGLTGGGISYGRGSREHWSEIRTDGTLGDFGRRKWSVSGRAWVDYSQNGNPVRHFREVPQGGHILADMRGVPAHSWHGRTSVWHRYDAEYTQVATGDRTWGLGRAWTDNMLDPATGQMKLVHQKISRVAGWGNLDNLRRFHAHDINPNGSWSSHWKGVSPHGKEVGGSAPMKNGDTLNTQRIAEQRPPHWYRTWLSSEVRHTDFGPGWFGRHFGGAPRLDADGVPVVQAPWARDNTLQVGRWEQVRGGETIDHGVSFTSQQEYLKIRMSHTGAVTDETRKLMNGNELRVGDVEMPEGVTLPNHYQAWSEGADNLKGHRSYNPADFNNINLPAQSGLRGQDVLFVDRFHVNPNAADAFTPTANAADWNITRVGFKDGTMLEYRPRPQAGVDNALDVRRTAHQGGNADWTHLDHHGAVIARQDTFGLGADGFQVWAKGSDNPFSNSFKWEDSNGNTGIRKVSAANGIHYRGWDRHSFQDFQGGRLVHEHRLFADGATVQSWKLPGAAGDVGENWRWNKMDANGVAKEFGNQGDRVRVWYKGNTEFDSWQPGARWVDFMGTGDDAVRIQEIPNFAKSGNPVRDMLTTNPFRVREYAATPDDLGAVRGADAYRAWKEHDAGIVTREMKRLPDGTFLEKDTWQKQWRRYAFGADGTHHVINERTIHGNVFEYDTFGRATLVGRETHFIDFSNEFRGYTREWREPLRWSWGPAVTNAPGGVRGAESLYTPFLFNSTGALLVEGAQEFVLDFVMNLAVFGIVSAATGTPFTITDVQQAAFAAALGTGVKTLSGGLHNWAAHRFGWKSGWGNHDQGLPYHYRQNNDDVAGEFAGNEKVLRWRAGTYDFFKDTSVGALTGFAAGAAGAAIFGVKDSEGERHLLSGGDAALFGAAGALGGVIGGLSVAAVRGMIQNTAASRFYHRAGVIDFLVMPIIGKLMDKTLAYLVFGPIIRPALGITPPEPAPQPTPTPVPTPAPGTNP